MNRSLSSTLRLIIENAWRWRALIVLPMAIVLPAGILYATFGPKTYVAKSLMLLQESARDFPTSRDLPAYSRIQERIAGLQALLKSDRVLYSAMRDIDDDDMPTSPDKMAGWIKRFSNALTLELVGTDFLEFQLKGSKPNGLGKQLEAVTSRFLEALLSSPDALNATQFLLSRRKKELDVAERRYSQLKEQAALRLPPNHRTAAARLTSQQQLLKERTGALAALGPELDDLRKQVGDVGSPASERPHLNIAKAGIQVSEHDAGRTGTLVDAQGPVQPSAGLVLLQSAEAKHSTLQAEVKKLAESIEETKREIAVYHQTTHQLQLIEEEVQTARESYQDFVARYSPPPASIRAPGILNAPERIKLIDAPRDPELPTKSALTIALASVVAGMLAAFGLVFLAAQLDQTVRRSDELEELTGVPVLARLP